jgi:hypothetical protein
VQVYGSELELVKEESKTGRYSPERLILYPGVEELLDRDIPTRDYKMMLRAKRKNLKSATA